MLAPLRGARITMTRPNMRLRAALVQRSCADTAEGRTLFLPQRAGTGKNGIESQR
jgi:hypothetical protein